MAKWLKILLIVTSLLIIVVGIGYYFYQKTKNTASDFFNSAKQASDNVISQNAVKFGINSGKLPKEDVAGEDPADLKRMPYTIRTKFLTNGAGKITEYQVFRPQNMALGFYKTELAKNNYVLQSTTESKIIFSKDGNNIVVEIISNIDGVTTYQISW